MADDDSTVGFGLVMPFVNVTSKGGEYADISYVAGYEMGQLDALLEHQQPPAPDPARVAR